MSEEIPVINNPTPKVEPIPYRKRKGVHNVLVITNDSTVFLTDKWVSAFEMFGGRVTEVEKLVCDIEARRASPKVFFSDCRRARKNRLPTMTNATSSRRASMKRAAAKQAIAP